MTKDSTRIVLNEERYKKLMDFIDETIDFINSRKLTPDTVLNGLVRVACLVASKGPGTREQFMEGVQQTWDEIVSQGPS